MRTIINEEHPTYKHNGNEPPDRLIPTIHHYPTQSVLILPLLLVLQVLPLLLVIPLLPVLALLDHVVRPLLVFACKAQEVKRFFCVSQALFTLSSVQQATTKTPLRQSQPRFKIPTQLQIPNITPQYHFPLLPTFLTTWCDRSLCFPFFHPSPSRSGLGSGRFILTRLAWVFPIPSFLLHPHPLR